MLPGLAPAIVTDRDPHWNSVELLLNFRGANGSTSFVDSSKNASALTPAGNAQINNQEGLFDGTGDYVYSDGISQLAHTGDFTLEFAMRRNAFVGAEIYGVVDTRSAGTPAVGICFYLWNTGRMTFFMDNADRITNMGTIVQGQRHDIAVTRAGTTCRVFLDGTQVGTHTSSGSVSSPGSLTLGTIITQRNTAGNFHYAGALLGLRYTRGVARYTAAYTPPKVPFPAR